jgi:S1-C subfamily serine protease
VAATGVIHRSELRRFIKLGPQRFIRQVSVRPAFHRKKFFGWRIISYRGPGAIRPGDVVMRVNGGLVERPDQFMAVWDTLERRKDLVVDLVREGRTITLRYPIVD